MASLRKLLFLFLGFFAPQLLLAQQTLVTLKNNNISMTEVIEAIESNSGYTFLYSDALVSH